MYIFGQVCSSAIDAYFAVWFVTYFNNGKFKHDRKALLYMLIIFAFNSVGSIIGMSMHSFFVDVIITLVVSSLITLIILSIYSYKSFNELSVLKKALPPFILQSCVISSSLIAGTMASLLFDTSILDSINSADMDGLVYIAINKIVIILLMFLSVKLCRNLKDSKILYSILPLPITLIIIVLLFPVANYFQNFFSYSLNVFYISIVVISVLSAFGSYSMLYQTYKKAQLEKEKELYQNMLQLEAKRYEEIKNSSNQIKKIRHDVKNMLLSVKTELDEKNLDQAQIRLDAILDNVNSVCNVIKSDNRTIDYIVNAKLGNIENRTVSVSGDVSGVDKINDVDISIILGNILDNAVEATNNVENAVVALSFFVKGNYQNILCENTISKSVIKENPNLNTSKFEKSNHGFGIKSIKEIVKTYDGSVDIFEKENRFCVHIMFPINTI